MLTRDRQRELRGRLFRHLDGIVTAPTVHALSQRGVLDTLTQQQECTLSDLTSAFEANDGYLNVGLRVLASQGWLTHRIAASGEDVHYAITEAGRAAFQSAGLYDDVVELMQFTGRFHPRRFEVEPFRRMEACCRRYSEERQRSAGRDVVRDQMLVHVEGALFGPTIVRLGMSGMFHKYFMEASFRPEEFHEDGESFGRLLSMFSELGWFTQKNGTFRFTDEGLFFARRASAYGVTVSYLPTLRALDELMFGDPNALRTDVGEAELHVDRETNVWGSGGAHAAYFHAIDEIIVELFNRPIAEQPKGVVDVGCGNGAFLEHLFDVIAHRTARGRMLDDHPLFLVGVDFNEAALRVTRTNLTRADIWAKVIWGDVGRPDQLAHDLMEDYGIDVRDLLSVRTFLDHNRPWTPPTGSEAPTVSASTGGFASKGLRIRNTHVEASLREHLERWARYVGRFGLLVMELHTLPPEVAAAHLGQTAVTAYDATHGFSDQYIVEVDVFEQVAAQAGLRAVADHAARFPDSELATVTVNLLKGESAGRPPHPPQPRSRR